MAQRYTEWDKKRYKTTRSMPWWTRNVHIIQRIGWGVIFVWAFGGIYKTLLFPSSHHITRSLDPRHGEDAERLHKNIVEREKALFRKELEEELKRASSTKNQESVE